jgi:lipid-binding SYLF domain-containing protein
MQVLSGLRVGLLAIAALFGAVSIANAESGTISISIFKAGFIVGGSAGSGVLTF